MEIIRNNKGGQKLCYLEYMYTKKSATATTIRWECSKRTALTCKGTITTDLEIQNMVSSVDHCHEPNRFDVEAARVRQTLLARAAENRGNTGPLVIDHMSRMTARGIQALGQINSVKRSVRRKRQAARPLAPSSLDDLAIPDHWTTTGGDNPKPFLIYDNGIQARDRMVVFATEDGLRHLSRSDVWFMDGTFDTAPVLFEQLYVIRAPLGDSAVSCVYAFLTGKSQQIYEELLTAIVDKGEEIGVDMDPTTIVTDFEQAAINAVQTTLGPHVNNRGCFFHLTQSTWRKVQSLGLSQRYKDDDDVKHFCGMLDGLAFLPPDRVQDGMDYIRNHTTDELEDLVNYFDTTYVSGTYRRIINRNGPIRIRRIPALFPPEKWNVHETTIANGDRTNNLCESWNRAFKQLVGYSHPTVWAAIENIRKDACIVCLQLANDANGQRLKKRVRKVTRDLQQRLRNLCLDLTSGRKTLGETLQGLGHNIRL